MVDNIKFEVENIIFIVENSLYTILYKGFEEDEFIRLFDLWTDALYLENFFEENIDDLNNEFWDGISIEEAVLKTQKDALNLEDKLISLAEQEITNADEYEEYLSTFFQPISQSYDATKRPTKEKAYGQDFPSWLRIYALGVDTNLFVVTGGAIKLTKVMNDREHLKTELKKLDISKKFVIDYPTSTEGEDIAFFELIY